MLFRSEDIPDIDLYMDQVIQLFENKLGYLKRNEEDKILTKTMINNYSKGNLFMDIKNKKYSKNHIILIILIYELKSVISIPDIKVAFNNIVKSYDENSADKIDLENLYKKHLKMISKNDDDIKEEILNITKELENLNAEEEKLLLLTYLAAKANMYKRLCEKIVDDLF